MTTALIITTYNRPYLLLRCLDTIMGMSEFPNMIIFIDDNSDHETQRIINEFYAPCNVVKFFKNYNAGIKDSLSIGFELAFQHCDIAINLDPDAIVKPDFITKLKELKDRFRNRIVSGFNCNHPKNPVLATGAGYVSRQHCNGINMVISEFEFINIVKPALKSEGNWDYNSTNKHPFIISSPSVVQHIGDNDSTMGHRGGDVACDFKLFKLPTVTLFGIDAHDPNGLMKAAKESQRDIEFGDVKIITQRLFYGREGYSKFCIADMFNYIDTDHALIIHPDGYILNPQAWKDEWLEYDYIGAWWHFHSDGRGNGNGGFCLRSKKLIYAVAELAAAGVIKDFHPEDDVICRKFGSRLEKEYGIKFAPKEVCMEFSIEAYGAPTNKYNGQFGFHGKELNFDSLPKGMRPYEKTSAQQRKQSAIEMWRNRPKQQPVTRHVPRTRPHK